MERSVEHDRGAVQQRDARPRAQARPGSTDGFAVTVNVPNAPSIADLHTEYVEKGGRFYACPVCVKTRGMEDASWAKGAEVKGPPSLYEFTQGGALTFNY